jgi:hypothetical protein
MDEFIKSKFIESKFESLSPEERQAHTLSVVKSLMECIVGNTINFINIGVKAGAIDAPVVVKKKTRPKNPIRHRADGTYNSHSLVPDYNSTYYEQKTKGVKVNCSCCGLELLKSNYSKHKKSLKCTHVAMCQAHNALPS